MTSCIRILTTSGIDSNPSLLLVSPNGSKTLINCGEGCQRAFLESSSLGPHVNVGSLRVSSVNRVCLTHPGHDTFGGLPGMILTTADVAESVAMNFLESQNDGNNGKKQQQRSNRLKRNGSLVSDEGNEGMPDLEIIGPAGTKEFLHSLRHFMRRDRFNVHVHEGNFDSSLLRSISSEKHPPKKKTKKNKSKITSNDDIEFAVKAIPIGYNVEDSGTSKDFTKQAVSFIFTTPPIPGKFLIEKANALKIPRGPLYAQLKSGNSVTFTNPETNEERTVSPDEVLAEGSRGIGVVVLYCPNIKVLKGMQESEVFKALYCDISTDIEVDAVVHLTPRHLFESTEYQTWCKKFGATSMEHIVLHVAETLEDRVLDGTNSPFLSAMRGAVRRSLVNNELFPMPNLNFDDEETNSNSEHLKIVRGCPMMEYVLLPRSRRGVNELTTKPLYKKDHFASLKSEVFESGAVDLGEKIASGESSNIAHDLNSQDMIGCNGELIFTGTGSAVPCKHRNVTGMYLRMRNGNGLLLDVGEGTVGQLLQSWGSMANTNASFIDEYRNRIKGIKAVWISHPHADHHLGLLRLLSERSSLVDKDDKLVLMASPTMFAFLSEYQCVVPEVKGSYIAVDSRHMKEGLQPDIARKLLNDLQITQCISIPVAHCQHAYAIVLDGTSFGRVAYSGDCRPSKRFAAVGQGADLLIHEATFEDGMEEEAVLKRHSTVGEAIDIAVTMKAKALVLTHFSQRYPKIPSFNLDGRDENTLRDLTITIAFDFMRLRRDCMHLSSKLTPALKLLYPNDAEANKDTGMKDDKEANSGNAARDLMAAPGFFAEKGIL